jgi:hypothetical protein
VNGVSFSFGFRTMPYLGSCDQRKYSEVLWKGMPMADVAVRGGHIGKGVLVLWC